MHPEDVHYSCRDGVDRGDGLHSSERSGVAQVQPSGVRGLISMGGAKRYGTDPVEEAALWAEPECLQTCKACYRNSE